MLAQVAQGAYWWEWVPRWRQGEGEEQQQKVVVVVVGLQQPLGLLLSELQQLLEHLLKIQAKGWVMAVAPSSSLRPDWKSSRSDIQLCACDFVQGVDKVVTRVFEVLKFSHQAD